MSSGRMTTSTGSFFGEAAVHAGELLAVHFHDLIPDHDAVEDVALADEVRHKGVLRLVVDVLRRADLLDAALVHDHHGVGHGQGLLLVVGDIYKRDAHLLLDTLQLVLHILAQSQIQRAQRLVQQQNLGAVHQSAGRWPPAAAGRRKAGRYAGGQSPSG